MYQFPCWSIAKNCLCISRPVCEFLRLLDLSIKVVQFRTSGSLDKSHSEHFVGLPVLSGQFMNALLVTFPLMMST